MNPFTLDFSKYYDDIVSSLKTIFGYKYSNIIDERLGNVLLTTYSNYEGIKDYYEFLEDTKSRELCIKFLNKIGIDLSGFNIVSYADDFDLNLKELISKYLDGDYAFKSTFQVFPDTFRSFISENSNMCSKDTIINNRIKFINSVTSKNITRDTYFEFIKTDEYQKLLLLINKYNKIYIELCDEMNSYMESIKEYKNYYMSESSRYNEILDSKSKEFYEIVNLPIDEIRIDSKLSIEYFSKSDEDKINSDDKDLIISYRKRYLSSMGFDVNCDYYELVNRDDVKKVIPSFELVESITKEKNEKFDEVTRKFIYESDTFKRAVSNFILCDESKEYVYRMIKNKRVCVHAGISYGKFIPLMFLTLRRDECGTLDYIVLHEIIHALESEGIEDGNYRCGFEPKIFYGEKSPYIYKHPKRKYERLNETITDLFALEAVEVLHTLDIYFMDEKTRTKLNPGNNNTSLVLKTLIKLFLERYRELIIDARICGNMDMLYEHIGKNNFDEFNDIIDYIDMLIEMGLEKKLNERCMDDKLVLEYINEIKKLSNVYVSMDEHYKSYVSGNVKKLR